MKKFLFFYILFIASLHCSTHQSLSQVQKEPEYREAAKLVQKLIEKDKKDYKIFLQNNICPRLDSLTILTLLIPLTVYLAKIWHELESWKQALYTSFGLIIVIRALQTLLMIYEAESAAEKNHEQLEKLKELLKAY